jgi:hypothetical protein
MLKEFHLRYLNAARPPKRLSEWIKAITEDQFIRDNPDDDKAEHDIRHIKRHLTRYT